MESSSSRAFLRCTFTVLLTVMLISGSGLAANAQQATPGITASPAAALPVQSVPPQPVACAEHYQLPSGFTDGQNIDCATITVPAFHGESGSPQISLFYMDVHATGGNPASEPLIVLAGGPGQPGQVLLKTLLPPGQDNPSSLADLLTRQDVILLDQRGTGASEPNLACPGDAVTGLLPPGRGQGTETPAATPAGTPTPVTLPPWDEIAKSTIQCLQGFQSAGIDLSAINTEQNAADVATLIASLNRGQADLYGVSYGTLLGQTIISRYPDMVRSAVLASVLPTDVNFFTGQLQAFNDSLSVIFTACAADAECGQKYPDLDGALDRAYQQLSSAPVTVPATDPNSGAQVPVVINGDVFMQLVYQLAFGSAGYIEPALISSVANGDYSRLAKLAPIALSSEGINTGMLFATDCQDTVPGTTADDVRALVNGGTIRPAVAQGLGAQILSYYTICDALNLPTGAIADASLTSDVPTLLATGQLDPVTPPQYADDVASNLTNAQVVTLPALGHDPLTSLGPCGAKIIDSYLDDAASKVDTICAADLSLDFSPDQQGGSTATPATGTATPVG